MNRGGFDISMTRVEIKSTWGRQQNRAPIAPRRYRYIPILPSDHPMVQSSDFFLVVQSGERE
jgi:hypothetical protein